MYLATSLLVFFTISFLILALLPQSFTLGELMIVSQVLSILCIDFAISIYSRVSELCEGKFPTKMIALV